VWNRHERAKCPAEKHCSNSRGSRGYFIRFIITWGPEIGNRVELLRRDLPLEKCHIPSECVVREYMLALTKVKVILGVTLEMR